MAAALSPVPAKQIRCAVYTRKSTDEGLNQDFNSLDAQREACEAFIKSQRHDQWTLVPTHYNDGGYTGANIERPGVKQLLADIEAGKVDCVVVYKVDRLSRSLIDFARMMGIFEKCGVSFVSVTQQFNTSAPLGRLTLNILLSFAQFEREIISERTRDKAVAARKRGKWTGGHLILGYDLDARGGRLIVNEPEAERIREIFRLFLEGVAVTDIVRRCDRQQWRNKQWTTKGGKLSGGNPLRRCHIYGLLANVTYSGRVRAGSEVVTGEQDAVIDQRTFDLVQAKLQQSPWSSPVRPRTKSESLLRGVLYCAGCGGGMYATWSANRARRYRYYVCNRAQQRLQGSCTTKAVAAEVVEQAVVESIQRVGVNPDVVAETIRVARERLAVVVEALRTELSEVNAKVKNHRSQLSRLREAMPARVDELRELIADGDVRAEDLRAQLVRRERKGTDADELKRSLRSFTDLWKVLNLEEQRNLLAQLIEKVGYDGRSGKITVSFRSAEMKALITGAKK